MTDTAPTDTAPTDITPTVVRRAGRGLLLDVYRTARTDDIDTTNGGITGRCDRVTVVGIVDYRDPGDGRPKPQVGPMPLEARHWEPDDQSPPVWLYISDHDMYLQPADAATGQPDVRGGWMAGGNYAATTDDRWTRVLRHMVAVRVHDRREW